MPVPVGWEHVPAVGTGIGMQEMIKTTAAITPTSGLNERSVLDSFFNRYNPYPANGIATANHKSAQFHGKIPSEICMAWAFEAGARSQKTEDRRQQSPYRH